jgi:hypothetical protein
MTTLRPCPKRSFQRSTGGPEKSADHMSVSAAAMGRNKRQRLSWLRLRSRASGPASIGSAALASATANLAAILRCEVATIAASMAARRKRRGLFGPMCEKTASSRFRAMRQPIIKPRKKVYGRGRKPPVDTPEPEPVTVGAQVSEPVTTARLDKAETIELAKATFCAICIAQESPANAKATAARTLLELVGALGRHSDPTALNTVPASEMSLEQLDARIAALITH